MAEAREHRERSKNIIFVFPEQQNGCLQRRFYIAGSLVRTNVLTELGGFNAVILPHISYHGGQ